MTLGEAREKEAELREGFNPFEADAPWDDAHSEQEEKLEREALLKKKERVEDKKGGQRSAHEKGRPVPAQAQNASRQQSARNLLGGVPGGALGGATGTGFDGFELGGAQKAISKPRLDAPLPGGVPIAPRPRNASGALHVLNNAKDPGVYFREEGNEDGRAPEESEDPELAAAVEECIRLLFGVRGILRIGPGENDKGEPIIVIVPHRGFSESSMRAIPQRVHRYPTLVAIPYDLLPLRRDPI